MAPCGFTSGHSYKHWLIILWQEAVEAAGLIQHDSSCQYMIKYRATFKKKKISHILHLASINPALLVCSRKKGVLIKEQDGICTKDSQAMEGWKETELKTERQSSKPNYLLFFSFYSACIRFCMNNHQPEHTGSYCLETVSLLAFISSVICSELHIQYH